MVSYLLLADRIHKYFGGVHALEGATVGVRRKSITMVIGPNGSGKTTLINVISGVYKPDKGRVLLDKLDITGWPPHRVYRAGIVRTFQIPRLFWKLTVLENLLVAVRDHEGEKLGNALLRERWRKKEEELVERAMEILELLELDHLWDQRVSKLSGGQMKLVEIGRALMSQPKVMLMDEPIAGVNPKLAGYIFEHLLKLRKELGLSFLIVEHRLDIALQYVDYVYAMSNGKVVAEGLPEEVMENRAVLKAYLGD